MAPVSRRSCPRILGLGLDMLLLGDRVRVSLLVRRRTLNRKSRSTSWRPFASPSLRLRLNSSEEKLGGKGGGGMENGAEKEGGQE
jgi:hypothetical protein